MSLKWKGSREREEQFQQASMVDGMVRWWLCAALSQRRAHRAAPMALALALTLGVGEVELPIAGGTLTLTLGVTEDELPGALQLGGCAQSGSSADWHEPPPSPSHHEQPVVFWHASQVGTAGHHAAAHCSATGPPAASARHTPPSAALQLAGLAGPAGTSSGLS